MSQLASSCRCATPVLLLLAGLGACGSDQPPAAQDAPGAGLAAAARNAPPPCGFLDAAAASRILGESMNAGTEQIRQGDPAQGNALFLCLYEGVGSSTSLSVQVVWSQAYDGPASLAAYREQAKADAARSGNRMDQMTAEMLDSATEVTGIGRMAYWLADGRILTVHSGRGHVVAIGIGPEWERPNAARDLALSREVAAAVLAQL